MNIDEKIRIVKEVGEEIINENELKKLFEKKKNPIAYDGFEPSGKIHIAQGLLRTINVNKLEACFSQNPDIVRKQLGIEHHFCLFIEDKEGRVIYISDMPGVGDEELVIGPTPCGISITW